MIRYLTVGILVFAVFAVMFAPAGLLDRALAGSRADLTETRGTLWNGQGQLQVAPVALGQLTWSFQPSSLFKAQPTFGWTLHQDAWQLQGDAGTGFTIAALNVSGQAAASAINDQLRAYDINITGTFNISPTRIHFDRGAQKVVDLDGQVDWSGGTVRYTLAGILKQTNLPPMSAMLSINDAQVPQAVVYAEGQQTPLIIASLEANGFAKVAITKLFTKLLGNPYPGSDPDHAIVIQIEEKVI